MPGPLYDAKPTIEDGELVLRVPLVNVTGSRADIDHSERRERFTLELINGQELIVDRATYSLANAAMKDPRKTGEIRATLQCDPDEQAAFLKALTPPPEPPPDIEDIRKLWVDVALGYPSAAKQASALAVKHVGFLLGEVERLRAESDR